MDEKQAMAFALLKAQSDDSRPAVLTDGELRILTTNQAFVNIIGISKEKLIGMAIPDLGNKGYVKYLKNSGEGIAEALNKKSKTFGSSEIETPAGHFFIQRENIPLMDEKGIVTHIAVSYNDVTAFVESQNYMTTQFGRLAEAWKIIGAGDLTHRIEIDQPNDNTRAAYDTVRTVQQAVRTIIVPLQQNIKKSTEMTQELAAVSEEVTANTEEISAATREVANASSAVDTHVNGIEEAMKQITAGLGDSASSTQRVATIMTEVSVQANQVKDASEKGVGLSEKSLDATKRTVEAAHEVGKTLEEVVERMGEIAKMTQFVTDIANQTNLLALNAAIEAARAGDAGRGFAVVAAEVKSLALDSKGSTGKIDEIIDGLVKSANKANQQMKEAVSLAESGGVAVKETSESLGEIYNTIEKIAKSIIEVAAATEEQAAASEEITASAHEVSTMIDQTKSQASNTAAAAEETSASLDQISTAMTRVSTIAEEALAVNSKYKV